MKGRKNDHTKLQWHLLPWKQVEDVVRVLTHGAKKYSPFNWQHIDNFIDRYFSACMRHLSARVQGEIYDTETRLPHTAHAICCLLFIGWYDALHQKVKKEHKVT